jgi:hypothetical protein
MSKHEIEKMISKGTKDMQDRVELENKNSVVDRNEYDTKLRKWMQEAIWPLTEQGVKHKEQFLEHIAKIQDFETRVSFIETALFKSDNVEDRFEYLYRRIGEAEEARARDAQELRGLLSQHKVEIHGIVDT